MKPKKLNLADFNANKLNDEEVKNIFAGAPINPPTPPPAPPAPSGGGTGGNCYWDVESAQLICDEVDPKPPVSYS